MKMSKNLLLNFALIFIILALFVSFSLYSNFFTCFDIFHAFFACPVAISESKWPQISNTTIKQRKRLTKAEQDAIIPSLEQKDTLVGAFLHGGVMLIQENMPKVKFLPR